VCQLMEAGGWKVVGMDKLLLKASLRGEGAAYLAQSTIKPRAG
jgi:hypothetical protein